MGRSSRALRELQEIAPSPSEMEVTRPQGGYTAPAADDAVDAGAGKAGAGAGADDAGPPPPASNRPAIEVRDGSLDVIAMEAEDALRRSGRPVYQRAGKLVRPGRWPRRTESGAVALSAALQTMTHAAVLEELSAAARWVRWDGRKKDWRQIDPPPMVAQVLLARGQWKLRPISGVIAAPTLRPDGSLLIASGYDETTWLYHVADPRLVLPPIPEKPTKDDAGAALRVLRELLGEFPFASLPDEAVALAMLLTVVCRGAVGRAPAFAFTAHAPGSGKSLLGEMAAAIVLGAPCPGFTTGSGMEELEKRLGALLLEGHPILQIDNCDDAIRSAALCNLLTQPEARVRILGQSKAPPISFSGVLLLNGNNLVLDGDLVRRVLLGRLDPGMEKPWQRQFRVRQPIAAIEARRGELLAAGLTVVRAWLVAGKPGLDTRAALGSFQDWADTIRGALVWLGVPDVLDAMETVYETAPQVQTLTAALAAWHRQFGDQPKTVRAVLDAISGAAMNGPMGEARERHPLMVLRNALLPVCGARGELDALKVGRWLGRQEGRVAGGLRFKKAEKAHDNVQAWRVERRERSPDPAGH